MRRRLVVVAAGIAALSLSSTLVLKARQTPAPTGQTFRGATELLLVDVSVLDKSRQPVRDLKAADFTVFVDGKAQPVVAFNVVDVAQPPPVAAGAASWVRDVAPDVVTNEKKPGRVFVIVLDDYSMFAGMVEQSGVIQARQTAYAVVDAMGPDDRAAVVVPMAGHSSQDFTSDRQLLRTAIEKAPLFPRTNPGMGEPPREEELLDSACDCGACNIQTLGQIAQAMRSLPEQRKVLFNISAGSVVRPSDFSSSNPRVTHCAIVRREATIDAIRHAQMANVTIESFDPRLLRRGARYALDGPNGRDAIAETQAVLDDAAVYRMISLTTLSEETGGRAVVNNNDIDLQVPAVIAESSAYYLLGVERPPAADGKTHSLEVRVNRKDLEVRTRKGYRDETAKDRQAAAEAEKKGDLRSLVDSPLQISGVPLGVVAAAFPMEDGKPALALTLRVDTPTNAPTPRTETMDFVASLYYPETAASAGALQQRATMTFSKPDPRFSSYEIHSQLPAKPGRYALRVGVKTADGKTSSVYTTVIVPDFDDDLALSGLVLRAAPSPVNAGVKTIGDLLPITPTSQRAFRKTDDVSAFMRIYQKSKDFLPAKVTTTLTNAKNEKVANVDQTLEGEASGSRTAATYDLGLPVADLPAGEYLLSVSVTVGTKNAGRQLRFTVEAQ